MTRKLWLKNPVTGDMWDLLPDNPYDIEQGCPLLNPNGLGYSQNTDQEQVEIDYFIKMIQSKNTSVTGTLYFASDVHVENFQNFIGDFQRQFFLYYSPSGDFEPFDKLSSIFYKPVTVSKVEKSEKDQFGWYECPCEFTTQSDVWKRDVYLEIKGEKIQSGEGLVYPYIYPYVLGGKDLYAIEIPNRGNETGCIVRIKNNSEYHVRNVEWFIDHTYIDNFNHQHTETQRSKWYTQNASVTLGKGAELYVDSNATTQDAKVNLPDGTSQSVVLWQEPSWDYINFVRIKHGDNRIVFYVESDNVDISVTYQEQRELI